MGRLKGRALAAIARELGGEWKVVRGHHLEREYRFPDFARALAFVDAVGAIAERAGHHPDLELSWGRVGVRLFTHDVGGLTERDFVLAAKIEALARRGGRSGTRARRIR